MRRNELTNTTVANSDYESVIGHTIYSVHHKYGNDDLSDLVADYLSEKIADGDNQPAATKAA
ncbi:MAG: hypothetical protein J6O50_09360 [Ruminiclostridium sp.]|nr:hypothetical protein [Ruminiclostridium sp.]